MLGLEHIMSRTSFRCALGAGLLFALSAPLSATAPQGPSGDPAPPNLFNSVALPIARSPYDLRWRQAWQGGRGQVSKTASDGAERASFRHLAIVQRDINRRVTYRPDSPGSGAADSWSAAAVTLARGSGDCEDFAIAKAQKLLALGFRPQDLYLVIGQVPTLRTAHAILVVRSAGKFWVLDNLSREVVDADKFPDFRPVMTLSANRKWLHGFQTSVSPKLALAKVGRLRALPADRLSAVKLAQHRLPPRH